MSKSISEIEKHQILKLNYYKKEQKWWTDDVNGDCISFNLYRNTEKSLKKIVKTGEEISEKKSTARFINKFLFRRFNSDSVVYH